MFRVYKEITMSACDWLRLGLATLIIVEMRQDFAGMDKGGREDTLGHLRWKCWWYKYGQESRWGGRSEQSWREGGR